MQYRIIESRPATYYWEYLVEAESETEALNKVIDEGIAADEAWAEESEDDNSDYEIYQVD